MKHLSTLSLMLLLALTWIVPKANAQYTISLKSQASDWYQYFPDGTNPGGFYLQSAVSGDRFYTLPAVNGTDQMTDTYYTKGFYFDGTTKATSFSCGSGSTYGNPYSGTTSSTLYNYAGPQLAADDAGNIWTSGIRGTNGPTGVIWSEWRSQLQYWAKANVPGGSSTSCKGVAMGSYAISGRSDFMKAYGDCVGSTGGNLWFCIGNTTKIECVSMKNAAATGKTTYSLPSTLSTQNTRSTCDQYASNKVCYAAGVQNPTSSNTAKIFKGVINGGSISWTDLGVKSWGSGAAMADFCGHEILVYSSSATQITIKDITTGTVIDSYSPFTTSSSSSWIKHDFDIKVNGTTAYIYVYVPGVGAARYSLIATAQAAPVTISSVKIVEDQDPNYVGRQNAEIVWDANPNWISQPTSYKVEYQYTYSNGSSDVTTTWREAGTTTTLPTESAPFIHYNLSYIKVGSGLITNSPSSYRYRVTPIFGSEAGAVSATSADVSPKFIPIAPRWIYLFGEQNYQGICMVQMYWDFPGYGIKPDSYDIYRDGVKINGEEHVGAFVHVDYDAKANHTHSYEIVTYYNDLDNTNPARSSIKTAEIGSRDWSKPKYTITEIYNFSIPAGEVEIDADAYGSYAPLTKGNIYSQGYFRDGKWYIAQRFNGKVKEGDVTKAIADAGQSTGGILVFDGDAQSQANGKMVGGKLLSLNTPIRHNQNRGVAVDDAGNIFVRGVGAYNSTDWCYVYEYQYPLTDGVVYKPNADGTYTAYTVDLSAAGINLEEQQQANTNDNTIGGRCDYFGMSGDVFSAEGGYLYLAPSQGRAVYVIKLTAGSGTTLNASLEGVWHENGNNQNTLSGVKPYASANENYAFPVNCEGREGHQFVFNLRSNLFRNLAIDKSVGKQTHSGTLNDRNGNAISGSPYTMNIKGVEGYATANPTLNVEGRIYDFHSRVNNPGGSTFEFNGELFIVTPISQYSTNTGSFYVGRGYRKTLSIDPVTGIHTRVQAKDADLCNIIPVGTVYQTDEANSSNTTASGMWCFGEVPDLAKEPEADKDGDGKADYAYIYIYAPGSRFAKYRLDPDGLFPPSPNEVDIVPDYERDYVDGEHNAGGDLLKYDAVVTWEAMENSYNTDGTGNFNVESYTITLCYEDGTPVLGEDGEPLTVTIPVYNSVTGESSEYVVLDENGNVVNYHYTFPDVDLYDADGNLITYVSQVVVHYRGVDGTAAEGKAQTSVKTEDEDNNDYDAVAPGGEVRVGVAEDWADWDGDKTQSKDDGYWDRYTIELDPTNPEWGDDQRKEPVSYYTITVSGEDSETNDAVNKQICDFYLYDPDSDTATEGVQNVTGLTPDENGYVHITDCKIPGDYVFTPDDDIPDVYWFEIDYTGGTQGTAAELEDGKKNPNEWTYTITADYAANNTKINKQASGDMENNGGVVTGVEIIDAKSSLSIYPVPATTAITVKSSDAINTIAIYSAAGVQVKAVEVEGENVVEVSIDDLAAGQYFVKVNNIRPVKIIKQ